MYAYIRQAREKKEIVEEKSKWYSFFRPMILWYRIKMGKIREKTFKGNTIYILPFLEGEEIKEKRLKKIKKNLETLLGKDMVKHVILSKEVQNRDEITKDLYRQNKNILEGRMLFSSMLIESLEYIAKIQETILEKQDIYVLVNDPSSFHMENLKLLAEKVRNLYIITNHIEKFQGLEDYLQDNLGIMINVSNNKKKNLRRAKWIVNMDFPEELIESYMINKTAMILNLEKKIEMKNKIFNGVIVNMLEINIKEEIMKSFQEEKMEDIFCPTILYESLVYKYGRLEMVRKQLEKDEVKISCLIGNNGKLSKEEYTRVI